MSASERAALVAWALLIGLVGALVLCQGTAEADRPIHQEPRDRCWNLAGVQSAEEFTHGIVRWKVRTEAKGDCRRKGLTIQ